MFTLSFVPSQKTNTCDGGAAGDKQHVGTYWALFSVGSSHFVVSEVRISDLKNLFPEEVDRTLGLWFLAEQFDFPFPAFALTFLPV